MVEFLILSERNFDKYINCLISLDNQQFPQPWKPSHWLGLFSNLDRYLISLLIVNNNIAGYSLFEFNEFDGFAHLYKILIKKEFQKKKLSSKLLNFTIKQLELRQVNSFYLEVAFENESAIALYEKFGFKRLNLKQNFYAKGHHAYAMQRITQ